MAVAAAAAAGPVFWRRLLGLLPGRPGLAALLGRLSDRLGRNRDRQRRRSPWLLLAPLLSPAVPQVTSPPCCLCPEGVHRFQWIRNLVPEFGVSSSHVRVLSSPAEFFELMKGQIRVAKRRVVMASLYLGTGPLEQELVDCLEGTLEKSLQAKFPSNLKVSILLDFTRGSRGRKNSRTMLLPLLQRFPEQVRVSLFHTPHLRGLLRLLIPERFNETIGLQHIKVYLFDNSVILSGANLSDSYFTNRQDRYVFLQDCVEIADFFTELVDAVGDVSLQLQGDDTVQVVDGMVHPYKGDRAEYCKAANKRVMDVINSARTRQQMLHAQTFHGNSLLTQEDAAAAGDRRPAPDTWIYPLIQMKPFEIQIDEMVTETLLTEAERGAKIYLTTGYFNLTQAYMDLVLGTRAEYQILLASPEVNGFFGAKGVAGAIPAAYVHIERQFYSEVCSLGQQERVQLQEYWRRGWTFHAKGARAALPEVRGGVLCHLRAAESPGEAVGEDGDSTDQELLLRTDRSSFLPFPPEGWQQSLSPFMGSGCMGSPGLRQGQLQPPHQAELQFEWLGIDGVAAWPHCPGQQHIRFCGTRVNIIVPQPG
ncbi:PREDICTED: CDP-diacylglycerol--glycerol-3-phosphate 3-phosphatidyltransferase, mitochondrial isoform X1 [Rhinopithecus bieti]|uniref:CDP-diacylglycerol--glycerol-3-phosphate 3-phosphatidyltransferase, mitochondrial isoform X1 n=1 Tax=Rhinopithecus bieti TaxID=61621 RepID=UPI00083C5246|nr:PREDICTED: CDP-diacylglycerol--glycerol-3-phosphate 3-phosphatidyltransferase, mitochondrial isoform X1 [Rhinopithecus bieti]